MRYSWANVALLLLLLIQTLTGYYGLVEGRESFRWILWLHGIGAYAIVVLLYWKSSIILDAWGRKKRWTMRRAGFVVLVVLLLLTLLAGLAWTFYGPLYLFGFSLVSLHIYLAVPLMLLMVWHFWHMRFVLRVRQSLGRRLFLGTAVAAITGLLAWRASNWGKSRFALPGATRRFTGSYETGSFTGNFPVVSWIADRPPPVDGTQWRLVIEGAVERPLSFTYQELRQLATAERTETLDCTGGWYSTQVWGGVAVGRLLAMAGVRETARSVTFASVTGYNRRFGLEEAGGYLLALAVAGRPLSRGHGFPARLVAPGRRGVEWVKWVTHIRVNESSRHWQPPLPLQ
jgi:DMSO/TMAO reductase YedYZ molybdopterin-dependent catalytic subunit